MYNTEVLKSNLCNYNDTSTLVRGDINIVGNNEHQGAFRNCAPFGKSITKIVVTIIDNAKDLVISMYSFLEYSLNYSDVMNQIFLMLTLHIISSLLTMRLNYLET